MTFVTVAYLVLSHAAAMLRGRRVIIVRPGDPALFERLRERFANDPDTVIIYDRRVYDRRIAPQRGAPPSPGNGDDRRRGDRRLSQNDDILADRGFYASRQRRPR